MDFDVENDQNDEQQVGGDEGDAGGDYDNLFGDEAGAEVLLHHQIFEFFREIPPDT
jgi:hypothetical protein